MIKLFKGFRRYETLLAGERSSDFVIPSFGFKSWDNRQAKVLGGDHWPICIKLQADQVPPGNLISLKMGS